MSILKRRITKYLNVLSFLLTTGPTAIGIPGEVAGFIVAHDQLGKAPWADLVQPAIDLARHGFPVSPLLADLIKANEQAIRENNGLR